MSTPEVEPSRLAMIVAVSQNDVIGRDGDLPWRLSADLKRFKRLTMGHHLIMGRKTYDSIGRILPGRETVIVTRNREFQVAGATVVHSIQQALAVCQGDDQPFLTGGGEIYQLGMEWVQEIFLTRVAKQMEGDTRLPEIDWDRWELVDREDHPADENNEADYSFLHYRRRIC